MPSFQQTQLSHKVMIVSWLKAYFLHQIFGVFLFIVHAQPFRNIVDSRSLHLGTIPLFLYRPFSLLVPFDAQQLFFPYLEFNISELRCIHHLFLQMLLDDFFQIALPCLLVLFGNKWRTLLSAKVCQVNGSKSRCQRKDLCCGFLCFIIFRDMLILLKISLSSNSVLNAH